MPPPYKLRLNKKAQKGWHDIKSRDPKGLNEVERFLRTNPELRLPGKVKRLKGKFQGLLQYDVNYGDRVWYWFDKQEGIVYIEYAGPHP